MMELLSPAGSYEAAVAAVQNGADAIYLGYGNFNARRNAANFDDKSLRETVDYCRMRGVKVYLTLNTLLSDEELEQASRLVAMCSEIGITALIVQDVGAVEMVHRMAPDLPIHGSTQMTVHNLDGVLACAAMGMERVVLSRELSREQIRYICKHSPIEIEVFVHGALCMCYSGQCFLSAMIGGRSGNRGLCAQPCRMKYGWQGAADSYPLSLKDMSLANYVTELEEMGVACAKIEGRMKRPEYVGIVTRVYADALREHRNPTPQELEQLRAAFSRQGFTDGYYLGKTGRHMFGVREKEQIPEKLFARTRQEYNREHTMVPVAFQAEIYENEPIRIWVEDIDGNQVEADGPVPQKARSRATTEEDVIAQLSRTGGTPYFVDQCEVDMDEGLAVPLSVLNRLRRELLDNLGSKRIVPPERRKGSFQITTENQPQNKVEYTVSLRQGKQLTDELIRMEPRVIYLSPEDILEQKQKVERAMEQGIEICAVMPRILSDPERPELEELLTRVKEMGVYSALAGDWGGSAIAMRNDFSVRGDFGLGVYNSVTLEKMQEMGFLSATLSFEQRLARIRDLKKPLDTEIIVYGRLPLMITQNCIIHNRNQRCNCQSSNQLTDRTGAQFPVLKARGCRNEIFNSKKLFLADKKESYQGIGVWGARLSFTTENPRECITVCESYMKSNSGFAPSDITRGLYFRGVE